MADDLTDLERWFVDRGIPHFIDDYDSSTRVWTRALPFLVVTYALAAFPLGGHGVADSALKFAATLAVMLAAWIVANIVRGRPPLSRPRRVGRVELAVYVLGPTLGHLVFGDGSAVGFVLLGQLLGLGIAYVVTSYALIPLTTWTVRRSVRSLRVAGPATARALPLLLLVVTFFFLTTEVWQVFAGLKGLPYGLTLMMFVVAGAAFAYNRGKAELAESVDLDPDVVGALVAGTPAESLSSGLRPSDLEGAGEPLRRRQRTNLLLVVVVNQVLLALVVATVIGVFFLLLGFLALDNKLIETWVLHPADPLFSLTISGRTLIMSAELVRVTGFLATFSGFYFGVQSTVDPQLRAGLDVFAQDDLRELFAIRRVYLASLGGHDRTGAPHDPR